MGSSAQFTPLNLQERAMVQTNAFPASPAGTIAEYDLTLY